MKKFVFFMLLLLLVVTVSACDSTESASSNSITTAELTEREEGILAVTTEQSLVFDFQVDSTYKKASVWIEKYEFGEPVNNQVIQLGAPIKENGTIIFTASEMVGDENRSLFNLGIHSNGATASTNGLETIIDDGWKDRRSMWDSNQTENDEFANEMVLASMCYVKGTGSMQTLSADFYQDVDGHIDEIKDYDVVYLLKSEFVE